MDLSTLFDEAPTPLLTEGGLAPGRALVFPHTKLAVSGHLVAAVADAVVRSGADRVLAIGVLHGGKGERGVHREVPDEFSLDGFLALIEVASRRAGRTAPEVLTRYPFGVGEDPAGLPGMEELRVLARDCTVVATTDPVHHGAGYGTPESDWTRDPEYARAAILEQTRALERRDYPAFQKAVVAYRSDFRDSGPTLAELVRPSQLDVRELMLVDYADTLGAGQPTWVAAALLECRP